jgi:predicted HTH transcriptional regulator
MRFHRFTELLEEGEGLNVEFKRKVSTPEKIAREMIAFANTSGGVILFGVDDDRSIVGVDSEKGELEFIMQAINELSDPPLQHEVTIFSVRGRDVLCIEIPESTEKPHFLVEQSDDEPKAYVRVGENSIQASREMIKVMMHQSGKTGPVRIILGEAEHRLFRYFETSDRITVAEYAKLINVSARRASRLLIRLVRAGVLAIHTSEKTDFFTLTKLPEDAG